MSGAGPYFGRSAVAKSLTTLSTDIFSSDARLIVAEDVLLIAECLGYRALTTGHLLIATLENTDERTSEIIRALPDTREITAAVIDARRDEGET